mgnify:CR=1 FL=1
MKLLLTSEGITNASIATALLELLGQPFEKSRATYIPTAANGEKGDKSWVEVDMNGIWKLGFLSFDVVDISIVSKDIWLSSFTKADVLVFGGGNVDYLLTWMKKTGAAAVLPQLLKTKVYVGISAGSMATAKNISLYQVYEKTKKFDNVNGLGFVDFEIRPHLNSPSFPKVRLDYLEKISRKTPTTFYAIDDASAVQVVDHKVTVISEGVWKRFNE